MTKRDARVTVVGEIETEREELPDGSTRETTYVRTPGGRELVHACIHAAPPSMDAKTYDAIAPPNPYEVARVQQESEARDLAEKAAKADEARRRPRRPRRSVAIQGEADRLVALYPDEGGGALFWRLEEDEFAEVYRDDQRVYAADCEKKGIKASTFARHYVGRAKRDS